MKAQPISEGILRRGSYDSFDTFHVTCDCSDNEHSIEVFISREKEVSDLYVTVEFYSTFHTPFSSFWKRIKMAISLIFTGVISIERCTILSEQTALNFGTALIDTVNKHQEALNK